MKHLTFHIGPNSKMELVYNNNYADLILINKGKKERLSCTQGTFAEVKKEFYDMQTKMENIRNNRMYILYLDDKNSMLREISRSLYRQQQESR